MFIINYIIMRDVMKNTHNGMQTKVTLIKDNCISTTDY